MRADYGGRMSEPAAVGIATQSLTKHYGHTVALDALSMEVRPGEVFGFLGPNGAGKTTTIRLLLGLIRPTSGSASAIRRTRSSSRALMRATRSEAHR